VNKRKEKKQFTESFGNEDLELVLASTLKVVSEPVVEQDLGRDVVRTVKADVHVAIRPTYSLQSANQKPKNQKTKKS
jgi:hypothetical protein